MQLAAVPIKITVPWGTNAGANFIRTVPNASVPQTGSTQGWASYSDGFPPLCFTSIAAGGIPPFGKDMNGALNQITQWVRWTGAGGAIYYDPAFQSTIAGYPKGARISSGRQDNLLWQSTIDNNTGNPDQDNGAPGWQVPTFSEPGYTSGTVPLAAIVIDGSMGGGFGANIRMIGTGTTPKKYLRSVSGHFGIVNDAYLTEILTLSDAGNLSVTGDFNTVGHITGGYIKSNGDAYVTGNTICAGALTVDSVINAVGTIFLGNPAWGSAIFTASTPQPALGIIFLQLNGLAHQLSVLGYNGPLTYNSPAHDQVNDYAWTCDANGNTLQRGSCGATSFPIASDVTLKTNIAPFTTGLAAIRRINPISYEFTEASPFGPPGIIHHGVAAQDVLTVLPEAVVPLPQPDQSVVLGVDPATVLYAAVNAIKELARRLDAMEGSRANASA